MLSDLVLIFVTGGYDAVNHGIVYQVGKYYKSVGTEKK